MPFTFLAHQAAVLPLKLARPRRVSGTALVVGSMVPDFEYFVRGEPIAFVGHGVPWAFAWGLLVVDLPVALVVVWLIRRVIAAPLARHLPDLGPFRVHDYAALAAPEPPGYWLRAVVGAMVGIASHVVWDGFTHDWGIVAQALPPLQTATLGVGARRVPLVVVLWAVSTALGALLTVALLYRVGQRRLLAQWAGLGPASAASPTRAERVRFWTRLALLVLVGVALSVLSRHHLPRPSFDPPPWITVALRSGAFGFVALAVACAMEAGGAQGQRR